MSWDVWKTISPINVTVGNEDQQRIRGRLKNGWPDIMADFLVLACPIVFKSHFVTDSRVCIQAKCLKSDCPARFCIEIKTHNSIEKDIEVEIRQENEAMSHILTDLRPLKGEKRKTVGKEMEKKSATEYFYTNFAKNPTNAHHSIDVIKKAKSEYKLQDRKDLSWIFDLLEEKKTGRICIYS